MDAQTCYRCFHPLHGAASCPHCGYNNDSYRAEPHFLPPGTLLRGRYMLGAALGEGGFGITYAGFDTSLDRRVAVKEFFPQGSVWREAEKSAQVSSFTSQAQQTVFQNGKLKSLQEAKSLAKLDDVGAIVRVLDFFEENNTAYIIMEFVEGVTLKAHVRRLSGPMPANEAIPLLLPVMRALEIMHKRGFVHRDISPDNIMLPPSGEAKLLDFGAVKAVTDAAGNATEHPVVKRGFSPIELYSSEGLIGPWSDVYAMCATIYYLITGQILQEPMNRINNDDLTLAALAKAAGPRLQAALLQGLAVHPAKRCQTMEALEAALEAALAAKDDESYTVSLETPLDQTVSLPDGMFYPPTPNNATQTAIQQPVQRTAAEESRTLPVANNAVSPPPKPKGGFWSTPRARLVLLAGATGIVLLIVLSVIVLKNRQPASVERSGKIGGGNVENAAETADADNEATEPDEPATGGDPNGVVSDDPGDHQFRLEGLVYSLPLKYANLHADGWAFNPYGEATEDTMLAAGEHQKYRLSLDSATDVTAEFYNDSSEKRPLKNCVICGISADLYDNVSFEIAKGISLAEYTPDAVLAALGEPSWSSEGTETDDHIALSYDLQPGMLWFSYFYYSSDSTMWKATSIEITNY